MRSQTGEDSCFNTFIHAFEKIRSNTFAVVRPFNEPVYKVLVGAVKLPDEKSHPLPGFSHAANILNVFAVSGIDIARNLILGVVIYGPAVLGCIRNGLYAGKFGKENPNIALAGELRRAGVNMMACGRMLQQMRVRQENLLEGITITASGYLAIAEYRRQGYILVPPSTVMV